MKILITGYKGFIAQNLGRYLHKQGHDVEGFDWIPNTLPAVDFYDQIIHLGAISETTCTDVEAVMDQNLDFSTRLLGLCEAHGTNLMYASSASVYGPLKNCKETAPCLPKSPYAWSKYLFDRVVTSADISSFGCRVQGFRYFNVFGEYEDHKGAQASIFHQFRKQALGGCIKPFINSDNYYRDFIYVGDICKITEKFLDIDESGIWNVGSGHAESIGTVAKFMAERMNVPIEEVEMPTSLLGQYQEYTCSDNTKLLNTIGDFKFTTPYEWMENGNKT
jgi:ADP-L-glycero-D-manno-heptose 6-epimerase